MTDVDSILASIDALEQRLDFAKVKLAYLRRDVAIMRPVYEAAKRYVTSPYREDLEDDLQATLENEVHAAMRKERA